MARSEFQLIRELARRFRAKTPGVVLGIGDDCAQIRPRPGYDLLYTVDSLVEKIHFSLKYFTPVQAAHKAVAASVSDIAAMGGAPKYIFLSLGIPKKLGDAWVSRFFSGVKTASRKFGVSLLGGNLTRSPDVFWANAFVVGEAKSDHVKTRAGAKPGDGIYVTGPLGSSALGLKLLRRNPKDRSPYSKAHRLPEPRLKAGVFLGAQKGVGAMIDISDGLIADLGHVLEASRVGAILDAAAIPIQKGARERAEALGARMRDLALAGGEDYELAFTVRKGVENDLIRKAGAKGLGLYRIGSIVAQRGGLKILGGKAPSKVGYRHF